MNKYLVDDKGMLFLLVFGLPPMVHTDDPARAVLSCFDMVAVFKKLGLGGRFGVTTGRNYCGVVGSASRMEYTVLGDSVNLSARLMSNAPPLGILVDEVTQTLSQEDVPYNALAPIKENPEEVGISRDGQIKFPGPCTSAFLGGRSKMTEMQNWRELIE